MSNEHINKAGEFQSDKYIWCKPGFVPLKLTDKTAWPVLWEYAEERKKVDKEFGLDLQLCLCRAGYEGPEAKVLEWPDDAPDWANFLKSYATSEEYLKEYPPHGKSDMYEIVTRPNYMEGRAYQTEKQWDEWKKDKKIEWIGCKFSGDCGVRLDYAGQWVEKQHTPWQFEDYLKAMPISHLLCKETGDLSECAVCQDSDFEQMAHWYTLPDGTELYK